MSAYIDRNYMAETLVTKIRADADMLYSRGLPILSQSGRYSSDLKNGIQSLIYIVSEMMGELLELAPLLVLPTFSWDEDSNATNVSIDSNYDIKITFLEDELLSNYDKNWIRIVGNNGLTPDEFITYSTAVLPSQGALEARIETLHKPPENINTWTNLKIFYNH